MAVVMKATVLWDVTPCSLVHSDISEDLLYSLSGRGHPDLLKRGHKSTRLHKATLKETQLLSLYLCDKEMVIQFIKWNNTANVRVT
jgi:hypothetical protein